MSAVADDLTRKRLSESLKILRTVGEDDESE
jgi:hypothetical protein